MKPDCAQKPCLMNRPADARSSAGRKRAVDSVFLNLEPIKTGDARAPFVGGKRRKAPANKSTARIRGGPTHRRSTSNRRPAKIQTLNTQSGVGRKAGGLSGESRLMLGGRREPAVQ